MKNNISNDSYVKYILQLENRKYELHKQIELFIKHKNIQQQKIFELFMDGKKKCLTKQFNNIKILCMKLMSALRQTERDIYVLEMEIKEIERIQEELTLGNRMKPMKISTVDKEKFLQL